MNQENADNSKKTNWKKYTIQAIKLAITGLVLYFLYANFSKAFSDIQAQGFKFSEINLTWLMISGVLYLIGSLPMGYFWYRILIAMQQKPNLFLSVRAFFMGHLGKYVPGKALVVVLRTSLVRGSTVDSTVAAVAVFIETLTMVAVGAVYASGIIAVLYYQKVWLLTLAVLMAICATVPTYPTLFRKIVTILRVRKLNPQIEELLQGIDLKLMGYGWLLNFIGWSFMGGSLLAVFYAIPGVEYGHPLELIPLMIATVCLAMVSGFVTPIPGGLGIRELVIMGLLEIYFSSAVAAVAAVLLRLSWIVAEMVLGLLFYLSMFVIPNSPKENDTESSADSIPPMNSE